MLAASGETSYISSLQPAASSGVMRKPNLDPYICQENESEVLAGMQEMLQFDYHPWLEMQAVRSGHDALRMGRDWRDFTLARFQKRIPLVKDPFAVFSIPWLIQQLKFKVVVTIRHPAAFTSSLKA
jgi:hypothetical protein